MLIEIQHQAKHYLGKLTSNDALSPSLNQEVRFNKSKFSEAIVLCHLNGNLTPDHLSVIIGYQFHSGNMDIITDFFLEIYF